VTDRHEDLPSVVEIPGDEAEQEPLPMEDPPVEPGDQAEPIVLPGAEEPGDGDKDKLPPMLA
jgi:hypothetical protein